MSKVISSILFFIAAIVIFVVWTLPTFKEIKNLKQEKNEVQKVLTSLKKIQDQRDDLLAKYNNIDPNDLERAKKLLPVSSDNGGLIVGFENLSKSHGLTLKTLSINEKQSRARSLVRGQARNYKVIDVNLRASGLYENLLVFLDDLERSLRVIDVVNLSFLAGSRDVYEFSIKAQTYAHLSPEKDSQDRVKEFLDSINILKRLEIDQLFFQDPVFASLIDFSGELGIEEAIKGRPNPFLPIGE